MDNKLIFERGRAGRATNYVGTSQAHCTPDAYVPAHLLRSSLELPDVGEAEVIRHYTGLSRKNFSVDTNFYPLGSCTMKYNPKINEYAASLEGLSGIHPYQNQLDLQGALGLLWDLEDMLCRITGMKRFTFQPASGAQGELTGMLMIRAYHESKGAAKTKVIIPDSAHGTNPASAAMCGYETVTVASGPDGLIDLEALRKAVDATTAAVMLTNPNTLGLFEHEIRAISDIIHAADGLLYYDGANFNALLGITTPALMGFDVIHLNLHKTFSTPHGCGGPGAGAVGASEELADFLPVPVVGKKGKRFFLDYQLKNSIGKVRSFYGNFSVLVRAFTYIKSLGAEGLRRVSEHAVLSANYLREKLKHNYTIAYQGPSMHEAVFTLTVQKEKGASALDVAKRLIDFGVHPPTMYFPLIVKEAFMIEPTETESKETLDAFVEALIAIDREIDSDCQTVTGAPHTMPVKRVDEVRAARFPDLRWKKSGV